MSFNRYARKVDKSQPEIVEALEAAGVLVYVIGWPCDLLCQYRGKWHTLEVKTPGPPSRLRRSDMSRQNEFLDLTRTPVVSTVNQALDAIFGA